MTDMDLYQRDTAVVAGIEKLRFFPLAVVDGQGCWLTEDSGRRLLDLSASWTASGLGHGHPAVTEAVTSALRRAPGASVLSAAHPDAVGLAEDLLSVVPGPADRRVYLGHSGSDANDVALRACRLASGKHRVVAFQHGYHGGVGLAMGVSGVHVDHFRCRDRRRRADSRAGDRGCPGWCGDGRGCGSFCRLVKAGGDEHGR
jgi:4-aminobutyrate aminotransferase